MRHREYLGNLRKMKRDNNLVADGLVTSEREPILPVDSPAAEAALINIMRKTGFTEAQIAKRFGRI
jgi:hypothetical protein